MPGDLPPEILNLPRNLKVGDTKVHRHPEVEAIAQVLGLYVLTPKSQRQVSWEELATELVAQFPGLEVDGSYLRKFCEDYIVPAVEVTPEWVKRALVRGELDLNTVKAKFEIAQKLKELFEAEAARKGARPGDVASLGKAAVEAYRQAEDSAERFQLVPSKKQVIETRTPDLGVDEALARLDKERRRKAV